MSCPKAVGIATVSRSGVVFSVVPGIIGIGYAFTDWSAYSKELHFVGLKNFQAVFGGNKDYLTYITNTLLFTLVTTVAKTGLGLLLAVLLSAGCLGKALAPRWKAVLRTWINKGELFSEAREILDRIPAEASVTAYKTFTVPLSDHAELYDLYYTEREHILSSDYVVAPAAKNEEGDEEGLNSFLVENGFRLIEELPGVLRVYGK